MRTFRNCYTIVARINGCVWIAGSSRWLSLHLPRDRLPQERRHTSPVARVRHSASRRWVDLSGADKEKSPRSCTLKYRNGGCSLLWLHRHSGSSHRNRRPDIGSHSHSEWIHYRSPRRQFLHPNISYQNPDTLLVLISIKKLKTWKTHPSKSGFILSKRVRRTPAGYHTKSPWKPLSPAFRGFKNSESITFSNIIVMPFFPFSVTIH